MTVCGRYRLRTTPTARELRCHPLTIRERLDLIFAEGTDGLADRRGVGIPNIHAGTPLPGSPLIACLTQFDVFRDPPTNRLPNVVVQKARIRMWEWRR